MHKKGAILLNLGSPDSTDPKDVKRYLAEFLGDERVIDVPFVRKVIVPAIILNTRPKKSAEAYEEVWTAEGSPLIVTSVKQQKAVQQRVSIPVELGMRYGNPAAPAAVDRLIAQGVEEIFIVPLYPHYAMSSYETAVVQVTEHVAKVKPEVRTRLLQPYYQDPEYIAALVQSARTYLDKGFDKLLFSFHGVPERHLTVSDPSHAHCLKMPDCCNNPHPCHATCYRHQCMMTVKHFVRKAGIPEDKYFVSFQSRLGRDPWLTPYTDKTLERFGKEGIERVKVICPAFVTDCLETLEEIAGEGREIFEEHGGKEFELIPCLNEHPAWIDWLVSRISAFAHGFEADHGGAAADATADHAAETPQRVAVEN